MQVSEAIQDADSLFGENITIEGIFVMKMAVGYMVGSETDIANPSVGILLDVPNLKKTLLSKVPAYGGSQFSYCNEARITGTLMANTIDSFPCSIKNIQKLDIYMYGEKFSVFP